MGIHDNHNDQHQTNHHAADGGQEAKSATVRSFWPPDEVTKRSAHANRGHTNTSAQARLTGLDTSPEGLAAS
jgi:hypothetical protein